MKILVRHRDSGSQKLMARLTAALPEFHFVESMPGEPVTLLEGVDAVIAVGKLDRTPMISGAFAFVQTIGTGYDHVDVESATEMGIWVANMPASQTGNAESVAEHAVLLMLALSRQLSRAQVNARGRLWAQPLGRTLLGKTACLVGLGDVGTALAVRLLAFGMNVVATRKDLSKAGPANVRVLAAGALHEALAEADYVVLCVRPGRDNLGMIDREALARTKKGAILINVARAELLDDGALLEALRSGHLRGAGLDVFREEPVDPDDPLLALGNVIATPHIAGVTDVNMARTLLLSADNLRRYARGDRPHYLLNPAVKPRAVPTVLGIDPLNS